MGNLCVSLFTTLDGSAERPDAWHFPYFDDAMGEAVDRHTGRCQAYLMGRVLHDQWASYWPTADDPFKDFINPIDKFVLSTTLDSSDWAHTQVVRTLDDVRALKERTPGWIGMSGSLTTLRSLLRAGLVDELDLLVDPIVVQGERRWTDDIGEVPLELVSAETLPTGVQHLVYRPLPVGNPSVEATAS